LRVSASLPGLSFENIMEVHL